jgi:predicted transposase/invertase (TIGR01784 family)
VINIAELLDPKNDYVFKRIFGHTGNEEITKGLLQSIIPDKIDKIELDSNPITEKDLLDDKVGILDIKAKLNDGNVNCDIEMQVVDQKDIEKRILFYWSKMYIQTLKVGEDYENLKRCIVILITDYDLDKLKEIPEYVTKWKIREEKYSKLVLTNDLELYIISLEKAKNSTKNKKEELYNWLKFINNPREVTRNGR